MFLIYRGGRTRRLAIWQGSPEQKFENHCSMRLRVRWEMVYETIFLLTHDEIKLENSWYDPKQGRHRFCCYCQPLVTCPAAHVCSLLSSTDKQLKPEAVNPSQVQEGWESNNRSITYDNLLNPFQYWMETEHPCAVLQYTWDREMLMAPWKLLLLLRGKYWEINWYPQPGWMRI